MAESGRFDPMVLESSLHYPETLVVRREANVVEEDPCMQITEAGEMGSSSMALMPAPEHGDCTGTRVAGEHGRDILTQSIGNGRTITDQQQREERPVLNPQTLSSRKRNMNWKDEETDLLIGEFVSQKTEPRSRLDDEPFWEGVANGVRGKTAKECRMRMETLKKSYNAVKEQCDKEKKEFGELKRADFKKMKLATRITERWYNQIRDHCPPRPAKRSRARGPGSFLTSDVATRSGPCRVSQSSAASVVLVCFVCEASLMVAISIEWMGSLPVCGVRDRESYRSTYMYAWSE